MKKPKRFGADELDKARNQLTRLIYCARRVVTIKGGKGFPSPDEREQAIKDLEEALDAFQRV